MSRVSVWETVLVTQLRHLIRSGRLDLHLPSGSHVRIGDMAARPVVVRIADATLPRRLSLNPDLALGEGYADGGLTVDDDDLHGLLALAMQNMTQGHATPGQRLANRLRRLLRRAFQANGAPRSRHNVAHHYDLSGALYDLFLDADRQYSCAYFREPDQSLEAAQADKKAHIAAKLCIRPGMRVLDIGCGWGGMAITLARDHGARVTGITLSEEQHRIATERVRAADLSDRVDIRIADYRSLSATYDRIVSVGMFEHVGAPNFATYFRVLSDRLADDGVALVHTIGRCAPPGGTNPWVRKYIFPGGYIPALSEISAAVERVGLWTTDVEVWRLHYARTLRHWHDRFMARSAEAAALYDERFVRLWRFYLAASEQTFRHGQQAVFQIQLAHRRDAVPLTRDYLYSAPVTGAVAAAE